MVSPEYGVAHHQRLIRLVGDVRARSLYFLLEPHDKAGRSMINLSISVRTLFPDPAHDLRLIDNRYLS
jgi:hypothetical protein